MSDSDIEDPTNEELEGNAPDDEVMGEDGLDDEFDAGETADDDESDAKPDEEEDDDEDEEGARPAGDEASEDEEEDDDEVEADLDAILRDRIAADDDEEDEDEDEASATVATPTPSPDGLVERQEDELHCPHCFLLVQAVAVADSGECGHCGGPIS